jgi:hypothetical protein
MSHLLAARSYIWIIVKWWRELGKTGQNLYQKPVFKKNWTILNAFKLLFLTYHNHLKDYRNNLNFVLVVNNKIGNK